MILFGPPNSVPNYKTFTQQRDTKGVEKGRAVCFLNQCFRPLSHSFLMLIVVPHYFIYPKGKQDILILWISLIGPAYMLLKNYVCKNVITSNCKKNKKRKV